MSLPNRIALCLLSLAATFGAEQNLASVSAGGGRSAAPQGIANDAAFSDISGLSTIVANAVTLRAGFIGKLTDVTAFAITPQNASVNEGQSIALSGQAQFDDATAARLSGNDIAWRAANFPLAEISAAGIARAAIVFTDTAANPTGAFGGITDTAPLSVRNISPDDFESYASDGLPDIWQVANFGLPPNPNAAPLADPFGTGNNLLKYFAGLDPKDPAATLRFAIAKNDADSLRLIISPVFADRLYEILISDEIPPAQWRAVTDCQSETLDGVRTITLRNLPAQRAAFFRLRISLPNL